METIILSKDRQQFIQSHTLRIFPDSRIVVPDYQADEYAEELPDNEIIPQPPMKTIGAVYDFCIDQANSLPFMILDDDITFLYSMVGRTSTKYEDPDVAMQVCENAAHISKEIGSKLFGFNITIRPMHFSPLLPIRFSGPFWVAVGFHTKDVRYDHELRFHPDLDICLESLKNERIIYADDRFCFYQEARSHGPGGNSSARTTDRRQAEMNYLSKKWGSYLKIGKEGDAVLTNNAVKRRQA